MKWDELFYYDETSPTCLRWKAPVFSGRDGNQVNCNAGDVAGSINRSQKKHSIVSVDYRYYLVHRIIFEMFFGKLSDFDFIDHIDGDGWNNNLSNLRKVTHAVNMRNCKKRCDNKTGVTGVHGYFSRHGIYYYGATWKMLDGSQGSKTFSTAKYGTELAFRLACEYREKMIAALNAAGAGYTDDHGKRGVNGYK